MRKVDAHSGLIYIYSMYHELLQSSWCNGRSLAEFSRVAAGLEEVLKGG